jgi:5-methylcytosine-specific restriction protein B
VREAFRDWLKAQPFKPATVSTKWADTSRIEKHYGDLDAAYDADGFQTILKQLAYTKTDERDGRSNPSQILIDGNVYNGLSAYRAALTLYARFRQAEASPTGPSLLRAEALDHLKAKFLARYSDFSGLRFSASEGQYWDDERAYKETVLAGASAALEAAPGGDQALGSAVLEVMRTPPANFVGWRTFSDIAGLAPDALTTVEQAIGEMVRDAGDAATVAAEAAQKIHPLLSANNAAFGQVRTLVTTALALARPNEAIAVKTRYMQRALRGLTGKAPFKNQLMSEGEYREVLAAAEAIFQIMRDDWGWEPRDLWDVQGFLWVTSEMYEGDAVDGEDAEGEVVTKSSASPKRAINLILYGPPGTGKTYATAAKSVLLCDGVLSGDHKAIVSRYRELLSRKRIEFVTFHQSYAYEDFVEGLRPDTTGEGEGGAGFSLKPHSGVFRRIAELAKASRGRAASAHQLDRTRKVFKMSLGRAAVDEDAAIYRDAIEGGYVALGYGGDVDWSDKAYDEFEAIKERWRQVEPKATGNDPNIAQTYSLRGNMRIGDLVVVSDGNSRFRAVGQVTGPYEFHPDEPNGYLHRRKVKWLWNSDEAQPRDLIYSRGFSMVSVYQLDSRQIHWDALEQIVGGGGAVTGAPEPFVLIIDEINRANVSKVFGELITLIEPDKRIGEDNEVTVTLPYSGDPFGVPANLHIIGTMNTADRSIALLDTALRRRFEFEELMPRPELLEQASADTGVDLVGVLRGLNQRIEYLFDRDHQIGHAYFMGCETLGDVNDVMRNKVIPLLSEYFYEDWEKVRLVLGEQADEGAFVTRIRLKAPKGATEFDADNGRWRYVPGTDFPVEAYDQLKA